MPSRSDSLPANPSVSSASHSKKQLSSSKAISKKRGSVKLLPKSIKAMLANAQREGDVSMTHPANSFDVPIDLDRSEDARSEGSSILDDEKNKDLSKKSDQKKYHSSMMRGPSASSVSRSSSPSKEDENLDERRKKTGCTKKRQGCLPRRYVPGRCTPSSPTDTSCPYSHFS